MVIKGTPVFTKQVQKLLDRESYRLLQLRLVAEPDAGDLIRGTGGCGRSGGKEPVEENAAVSG